MLIEKVQIAKVVTILVPLLAASVAASTAGAAPAPLFVDDSLLEITIDAPFTTLMDVRPDKAELKGSLHYLEADGAQRKLAIKLRTRGNYRREREHCDFAPIRLNFRKGEVPDTVFAGQNKLKLVTHCQTFEPEYEQIVIREYLAYALFRELTDISYGVRLMRITYFDTQKDSERTRFGFVIEDDRDVAKRNNLELIKARHIEHDFHDRQRQNLVHVFEYMIGNTEYSLVNPEPDKNCCHNVDILSAFETPPYLALPFDFDFSGFVNAPYAQPNPKYPVRSVRQRYYKGLCENNDVLPQTLQFFADKRGDLLAVIDAIREYAPAAARAARSAESYLQSFFRIIDDPELVRERLLDRCLDPEVPE